MPRGKYVKLIIGIDGTCQVDALNFPDGSCKAATQEITAALGGQIDHQHDKPEARCRAQAGQQQREGAR